MEHAGISVEAGPLDQLDQADQFDFDAFVPELDPEALEFGLEESYEQVEHDFAGDVVGDATAAHPDSKLADAVPPAHGSSGVEPAQTAATADGTGNDAEPESEYQDEIGYEDDDLENTGISTDLNATDVREIEVGLPGDLPEDHQNPESAQQVDKSHAEVLVDTKEASWDEDINFEEHSENVNSQDELGEASEEEFANEPEDNDVAVADYTDELERERLATTHSDDGDLDRALDELSHSFDEAPDVEVLYNEECYSLLGTSDDDPETYFLSEVQQLDRPLSQFLAALRAVISDELAPTDEVVVRFEPFDLEFGERSDAKFLGRTFREILDCHATLSQVPGISADPLITLKVRRDNEEHFLELLARAELVKNTPYETEDSEMSENLEEGLGPDGLDDQQAEDEPQASGKSDGSEEEGERTLIADLENTYEPSHGTTPNQDDAPQEPDQNTDAGAEAGAETPQPPSAVAEAFESEARLEDIPAETDSYEATEDAVVEDAAAEDTVDEEQAWDEQVLKDEADEELVLDEKAAAHEIGEEQGQNDLAAEDNTEGVQDTEVFLETSDEQTLQHVEQHDGNEFVEATELSTIVELAGTAIGEHEQEAGSNDDDLILAFDDDQDLPATHDDVDEHEEYTVTYDSTEIIANDVDGTEGLLDAGAAVESLNQDPENGVHNVAAAETPSAHTSTTLHGDEIDYEEENGAAASSASNVGGQQSAAASSIDNEEIDWENDENDENEYELNGDERGEDEESKEAALSPPSVAGKRSRTDEAESPADETDHKRRRT